MFETIPGLMDDIRNRFAQVDACPVQGPRIFFENAGGALTLNSVVDVSARYAAIPDNQGRANDGARALVQTITDAKSATMTLLNASSGQVFVGESGTELLFRMVMNACLGVEKGRVLGSTLEHPATRSACSRWARVAGLDYVQVVHDDATGSVSADAYAAMITPDTRVATILHTSPVTGMSVDVAAISKVIRATAPDCIIIVDGIQHAAHGHIDIDAYDVDGYAISPYKMFSRHGYGVAWISDRLTHLPHDSLDGGPEGNWELGTRDTGAYATLAEIPKYLEWLGAHFTDASTPRDRIEAAAKAIHDHEQTLTQAMVHGTGNLAGVADLPGVHIVGGADNPLREGLVSLWVDGVESVDLVEELNQAGIRTHLRKADHYSGNILDPLGRPDCVRVSMCHYNTLHEVAQFLAVMARITGPDAA
jgi:cysteine desulfurase/selenocysteine lyase